MGVLNVTPDSFYDGGRRAGVQAALKHARRLLAEGADLIDVGGESTRPGAHPVGAPEEMDRVLPVIEALVAQGGVRISVDTSKPEVAARAVGAGAEIWNDVQALRAPGAADAAARLGCGVVLMHMQGDPRTMQRDPRYGKVVEEVASWLADRAAAVQAAGVAADRIWLDPGLGFGKTLAHNLALLARLDHLCGLGFPVLAGASRKSFIQAIDPTATAEARLPGSLAAALAAAKAGCAVLRVHDVAQTRQALQVWEAVERARGA